MAFFDPAHVKIIDWSPAYFRATSAVWGPAVESAIEAADIPRSGRKLLRTAVVGLLALDAAKADPADWSPKGLQLVQIYTRNALQLIPKASHSEIDAVLKVAHAALDALNKA